MKIFYNLLKKFSIRQIAYFFVFVISLQVAVIIFIQIYQDRVTHSERSTRLVGYGINLVTWLGEDLKQDPAHLERDIDALRESSNNDALFTFNIGELDPAGYIVQKNMISFTDYNELIDQFKATNVVTISEYYPVLNKWGNFTIYNRDNFLIHYAIIIMMVIYLITIILLLFIFKGYRKLLPLWLFKISVGEVQKHTVFKPSQSDLSNIKKMQNKINKLMKDKTLMLSSLSHDLKTPLTSAYIFSKLLSKNSPEKAEDLNEILDELKTVIESSLTYAEVQYQCDLVSEKQKEKFLVKNIQGHLVKDYSKSEDRTQFYFNTPDNIYLTGNEALLIRAIKNLINNAHRYAEKCEVNFRLDEDNILIEISDNGPGIPEDKIKKVLTPYYSDKATLSKVKGGHGLGLAIVKLITQIHKGKIGIENIPKGGLQITLSLPKLDKTNL